ncbi:MAG: hypothetical protein A2W80_04430 [Candidatus Riflebacteria bacterium GWC2_50_8]|nr:MAG: hypothetical protein A2W80_04430 [Candidatus Riflebacteria bacterium GWC2_50_8]
MNKIKNTQALFLRLVQVFSRRLIYVCSILFIFLLLGIIVFPSTTAALDYSLYDLKHRVASRLRSPDKSLVVVGIDMQSLAGSNKRWPWPREDVAAVLQLLGKLKPKGIVVDILFQSNDTESGDTALVSAVKDLGNVLLISILEEKQNAQGLSLTRYASLDLFRKNALAEGFVWGIINSDGRLRSFRIHDERLKANSAALQAITHFSSATQLLSDLPDVAPVVFARKNGGIPVISVQSVLDNRPELKDFCRDKILVLGVNAQAVHDYHNTPLGIISGAEILAASIDTILSDRIGQFYFLSWPARAGSVVLGFFISWAMLMANFALLPVLSVFAAVLGCLLLFSELLLMHFPVAPLVFAWAITSFTLATAKYFDNLFSLQVMRHESATASLVQEQLLPSEELRFAEYGVFGISRSASALGGDYFDYFVIKDRYLLVLIGDATGHGVPAALAMAIGKATVLMGIEKNLLPAELIEAMNKILFKALRRKLMMTAALLWIDTETNKFEYRNCGHPYPYRYAADGTVDQISASGLFLGTKANYSPSQPLKGVMNRGEKILFYSDGLIESLPVANSEDAYVAFNDYLRGRPKLTAREACADIIDNHPFFKLKQPQPDDFTVLMIERV